MAQQQPLPPTFTTAKKYDFFHPKATPKKFQNYLRDELLRWRPPAGHVAAQPALSVASSQVSGVPVAPPVPEKYIINEFVDPILKSAILESEKGNKSFAIQNKDIWKVLTDYVEREIDFVQRSEENKKISSNKIPIRNASLQKFRVSNLNNDARRQIKATFTKAINRGKKKSKASNRQTDKQPTQKFKEKPHQPTEEERKFIEESDSE